MVLFDMAKLIIGNTAIARMKECNRGYIPVYQKIEQVRKARKDKLIIHFVGVCTLA